MDFVKEREGQAGTHENQIGPFLLLLVSPALRSPVAHDRAVEQQQQSEMEHDDVVARTAERRRNDGMMIITSISLPPCGFWKHY